VTLPVPSEQVARVPAPAEVPTPRIGGWLILPAFGLPISLLVDFVSAQRQLLPLIANGTALAAMNPSSPRYNLRWGFALIYELSGTTLRIVVLGLAVVFFFQRRRFVPKLIIGLYVASFAFVVGDYFLLLPFQVTQDQTLRQVVGALVACLIWVPYFSTSVRVRRTFVR